MNTAKSYALVVSILTAFFISSCYGHTKPEQQETPNAELLTVRLVQYEYDDTAKNEMKMFIQIVIKNNAQDTTFVPNKGGVNLLYNSKSFFYTCIHPGDTLIMKQMSAGENKILPNNTTYINLILSMKSVNYGRVDSLNYKELANKLNVQYRLASSDNLFYRDKILDTLIFNKNSKPTIELLPVNTDPEKASCGCH